MKYYNLYDVQSFTSQQFLISFNITEIDLNKKYCGLKYIFDKLKLLYFINTLSSIFNVIF